MNILQIVTKRRFNIKNYQNSARYLKKAAVTAKLTFKNTQNYSGWSPSEMSSCAKVTAFYQNLAVNHYLYRTLLTGKPRFFSCLYFTRIIFSTDFYTKSISVTVKALCVTAETRSKHQHTFYSNARIFPRRPVT